MNMMMIKVLKNVKSTQRLFIGIQSAFQRYPRELKTNPQFTEAGIKFIPESSLKQFESYYDNVSKDIIANQLITHLPKVNERFQKVLDCTVPNGRKIRSAVMLATYQLLKNGENVSLEALEHFYILCWCMEIFTSAFLIQDDIIDNSTLRRGQPAWYKQVGMQAISDSIILEAAVEKLLKKYFGNTKNYPEMIEGLMEMKRLGHVGQMMETLANTFDDFTLETYREIAYHKMTSWTFHIPIIWTALAAGKEHVIYSKELLEVIKEMGYLYTIMNDYMDIYGEKYFRKVGNDIQQNRCTWLIITALQRANPEQRKILEKCYGSYDEEKVLKVKKVYEELKIYEAYEVAEKESYDKQMDVVAKVSDKEIKYLLNGLIDAVYRRKL